MKEKPFEDVSLSSKKKNFLTSLINVFLLTIASILSYFLIGNNIVSASVANREYNDYLSQVNRFEHDLGIFQYDENDQKLDYSYISQVYIYNMITNTYFYENRDMLVNNVKVDLKEENSFGYIKDGKYVNDFLANYYFIQRESGDVKPNLTDPYSNKGNKYTYFYMDVLSFDNLRKYLNNDAFENADEYLGNKSIITFNAASKMLDYLNTGNTDSEGYTIFQQFQVSFSNAYSKTVKEISAYSSRYNSLKDSLSDLEKPVYGLHLLAFSICYLVCGFIIYCLFPLIFSSGKTPGNLIMNTHVVNEKSQPIHRFMGLLHGLLSILTSLISYGVFTLFYFSYAINNSMVIFHFPLQVVVAFSIILPLISLLMMFLSQNNQFLEDKICHVSSSDSLD